MIPIKPFFAIEGVEKNGYYHEHNLLKFTIPGKPIAKGRPRSYAIGGKNGKPFKGVRNVTPERTVRYESIVREEARHAMETHNLSPLQGTACLLIKAYWSWPKGMFKKTDPRPEAFHPSREDYDNVAKSISDAMNSIVYLDDKQIVVAAVGKFRAKQGDPDRAEVWIMSLESEWSNA